MCEIMTCIIQEALDITPSLFKEPVVQRNKTEQNKSSLMTVVS